MTDSEIPSMPKVLSPLVAVLELKKYMSMHAGLACFGKIIKKIILMKHPHQMATRTMTGEILKS